MIRGKKIDDKKWLALIAVLILALSLNILYNNYIKIDESIEISEVIKINSR